MHQHRTKWQHLPVGETPVLMIRFTEAASDGVVAFVKDRLEEHGMLVVADERRFARGGGWTHCLAITASRAALEDEAESTGLIKPTGEGTMEDFSVAAREDFVGIDRPDFFTQGERAQLVQSELDFIRVGGDDAAQATRLSRELDALGVEHDHGGINTLRHVLEANGLVDCVCPLHDEVEREELMWKVRVLSKDTHAW